MLHHLTWFCCVEWMIGLCGMVAAKVGFDAALDAPVFNAFAHLWLLGGGAFLLLGALCILKETREGAVAAELAQERR